MNKQQGFAAVLAIVIILIILGGGAYLYTKNKVVTPKVPVPIVVAPTPPAKVSTSVNPAPNTNPTTSWQTKSDSYNGISYEVKLPPELKAGRIGNQDFYYKNFNSDDKYFSLSIEPISRLASVADGPVKNDLEQVVSILKTLDTYSTVTAEKKSQLNGNPAVQWDVSSLWDTGSSVSIKTITIRGDYFVVLTLEVPKSNSISDGARDLNNQILSTFKFTSVVAKAQNLDCDILAGSSKPLDGYRIDLRKPLECAFNIGHGQMLKFRFTDQSSENQAKINVQVSSEAGVALQTITVVPTGAPPSYVMYPYFFSIKDDINFDGYKDILTTDWVGASMSSGGWWVYEPATRKFSKDSVVGTIGGPAFWSDERAITAHYHGSAFSGADTIYKFNDGKYQTSKKLEYDGQSCFASADGTQCNYDQATCTVTTYLNGQVSNKQVYSKPCVATEGGLYQSFRDAIVAP